MNNPTIGEQVKILKNVGMKTSDIARELNIHVTSVYYHIDPDRKKANIARSTKRRIENKIFAVKYKGGKCSKCGYNRCNDALVFHHKNPYEKDLIIAGTTLSRERVRLELDKTILLCSVCHIEFHAGLWTQEELNTFGLKFYPIGINTGRKILSPSKGKRYQNNENKSNITI